MPTNERFVFGSSGVSSGLGPDTVVSSSNSGLEEQEGAERTSVDISQYAGDKEGRVVPGTPHATSPEQSTEGLQSLLISKKG